MQCCLCFVWFLCKKTEDNKVQITSFVLCRFVSQSFQRGWANSTRDRAASHKFAVTVPWCKPDIRRPTRQLCQLETPCSLQCIFQHPDWNGRFRILHDCWSCCRCFATENEMAVGSTMSTLYLYRLIYPDSCRVWIVRTALVSEFAGAHN